MKNNMDIHKAAYLEEATELLAELETSLLELEQSPDDAETIAKVFRTLHTIKGSGAMLGFDEIASFTHEVESIFDCVRSGSIAVTGGLIDLTLKARDCIRSMLENSFGGEKTDETFIRDLIDSFQKMLPVENNSKEETAKKENVTPDMPNTTYRIRFSPSPDIFKTGTNPLRLIGELKGLGESMVTAQLDSIPFMDKIDPEKCYISWDIILTTNQGIDAVHDVFIFVEDTSEISIDVIDDGDKEEEGYKKLGEILVERGDVAKDEIEEVIRKKQLIGEMLVEEGIVTKDKIESALAEQQYLKEMREKRQREESGANIKVPAEKLDKLVDLVGELVTVQARLSQKSNTQDDAELALIAEEVERLTAELRDNALNIRMLPIGTIFGKFARLVRDLSRDLGKEIELTSEGEDTELDKTVIEKLSDPLVHLIRNCIDHGIELPDQREILDKHRTGRIHLSAAHSGANVEIEIRDDGKGLDKSAILLKAIEKGLISPGQELSDKEIFSFIFAPGFSTAKEVTNVSGRGVGMDVVKRAIDALRGTIDIVSKEGKGTTVIIRLPLTLAIIEGLLVTLGSHYYVLPLSVVEECVELTQEDTRKSHGRNLAHIRGDLVPYIRLRKEFEIPGDLPSIEQIVITGSNGERVGLVVDKVIGQHQTVIKNLGKCYKHVDAVSGATILGDGTVALIVDTMKVIKQVERTEAAY